MNLREFFTTQTWWGKLLGGLFGYLTGGPTGAFFGVIIGNFFDKGLSNFYSSPHWLYYAEKQKTIQKAFFETTFTVLGHMAKADGRVSKEEIHMAKVLMDEMRLSKAQKELAKRLFREGKLPTFNLSKALLHLKTICKDNRDLLKLFIDIQYRSAQAGELSEKKIKVMDDILSHLDFAPLHRQYRFYDDFDYSYAHKTSHQKSSHYDSRHSSRHHKTESPQNTLDHAFALLEVPKTASKQEVKRAYRKLLSRNHPDKLIAQGLPQEMIKIANEKTQKIVKAYEAICALKGW